MGYGYQYASDEGLPEVVPDPSPQALTGAEAQHRAQEHDDRDKYHVVYDNTPKYPDNDAHAQEAPHAFPMSPASSVPWESLAAGEGTAGGPDTQSEKRETEPMICGLRRKVFFMLLIAALVIVAAAVGGGVGGGVAAARSREGSGSAVTGSTSSSSSIAQASETTPTPTMATSTTSTSSQVLPTATFLNNQTGPVGFGFQGFSGVNFTGNATKIYRDEGFFDLGMECWSYVWLPNTTNCCVTFCEDQHNATGYRCQARKREQSSGGFPRVYIWCDPHGLELNLNGTCS